MVAGELEADPERVERVARAGILLDDEPLAAGRFGGGDDAFPVQIAAADLRESRLVVRVDGVILHVKRRKAARKGFAPGYGVPSPILHPVGVDFALDPARVGVGVYGIEYGVTTDAANLDTWRGMSYQTILFPADQKTGDAIYPYDKAR